MSCSVVEARGRVGPLEFLQRRLKFAEEEEDLWNKQDKADFYMAQLAMHVYDFHKSVVLGLTMGKTKLPDRNFDSFLHKPVKAGAPAPTGDVCAESSRVPEGWTEDEYREWRTRNMRGVVHAMMDPPDNARPREDEG